MVDRAILNQIADHRLFRICNCAERIHEFRQSAGDLGENHLVLVSEEPPRVEDTRDCLTKDEKRGTKTFTNTRAPPWECSTRPVLTRANKGLATMSTIFFQRHVEQRVSDTLYSTHGLS